LLTGRGPASFAPSSSLIFRYFNAAGAHPAAGPGEVHDPESHLTPRAIAAALQPERAGDGAILTINGDDYATEDGTCVRDYVDVLDRVEAHVVGRAGDPARFVADVGWQPRRGLGDIIASAEFHRLHGAV
jgi:hypothetical protein